MNQPVSDATRERIARLVLKLHIGLLVVIAAGIVRWISNAPSQPRIIGSILLIVPVLLPLRGIYQRDRKTFAWATLCLLPYIVVGLTELIANEAARDWAIGCLLLSFAAFVSCIAYLRVTRPQPTSVTAAND